MEREAVTLNLNDNLHARDVEESQSLPLTAVLSWAS